MARGDAGVDPFRGQHLAPVKRTMTTPDGKITVTMDETESPLAWLARRKGRDGRALIEPHQLQAGERLRFEFTRAQMMPRTTSNWDAPVTGECRGGNLPSTFTEAAIGARQSIRSTLDAVGPEFAGLLLDICCFLKGLADIERERSWPARSGKVVLQLALDRLARHYGFGAIARGAPRPRVQTWLAPDVAFTSGIDP
ncbi:MAG: DNA replication protein [Rhizobiales bacterium]|nr:DNA replication protein [Hyphomicrobiales bacterium]